MLHPATVSPRDPLVIAVIGGGISGLAVGHFLGRAGADFVVLEAQDRPGGVIHTRCLGGHLLELGPQRTRLTPPVRGLIEELGLGDEVLIAPELPLFIYSRGRLRQVPLDLRTALTTDLLGWPDRVRALVEPLTGPIRDHETAAEFFVRKFGRRTYDRLIAPLYGDLYASDPAEMPARHSLAAALRDFRIEGSLLGAMLRAFRNRQRAPACSFERGVQTLTDALAARLGDRLRTSAEVTGIRRAQGSREPGGRLVVETTSGNVAADRVILACPADAAATALTALEPDTAHRLRSLRYNPLAVVHLRTDAVLEGMGYQVALGDGFATRGVSWNHAMFGRRGIHTAFLGGATRPEVPSLPDEEVGALACGEFRTMTGADAEVLAVSRARMPAWDGSWDALDELRLPPEVSVCANWLARPGIAGRINDAERVAAHVTVADGSERRRDHAVPDRR